MSGDGLQSGLRAGDRLARHREKRRVSGLAADCRRSDYLSAKPRTEAMTAWICDAFSAVGGRPESHSQARAVDVDAAVRLDDLFGEV